MPRTQFQVKQGKRGFWFTLAKGKQTLFTSEIYPNENDCINAIEEIKKETLLADRFIIRIDKTFKPCFVFFSRLEKTIGKSRPYNSLPELEIGIEYFMEVVKTGEVKRLIKELIS